MGAKSPYYILLAGDHVVIRKGIKRIIDEIPELEVVCEMGDGIELLESLKKQTPEMIIPDLSMPNTGGIEATKKIKAIYP